MKSILIIAALATGVMSAQAQTYITTVNHGAGGTTLTTIGPGGTLKTQITRSSSSGFSGTGTYTPHSSGGYKAAGTYQPMGSGGYQPMGAGGYKPLGR